MAVVKPAWQGTGRNYDATKLTFWSADPGFILGESKLGEAKLGFDGTLTEIPGEFTSVTIEDPTTVENGLFVHREVLTCTLSATIPEKRDLQGKALVIKYGDTVIFGGRVRRSSLTEEVDVDRDYLPGNTPIKTYRLTLRATTGEEILATTKAPAREFDSTYDMAARIESWTGRNVVISSAASDLPVNTSNIGFDDTVFRIVQTTDEARTLLEVLRDEAKVRNMSVQYFPYEDPGVILRPNNQWLNFPATRATAFTLSDASLPTGTADDFLATEAKASYLSLSEDTDESLWADSVKPTFGYYVPPADPVDTVAGPFRLSDVGEDPEVNLGRLSWSTDPSDLAARTGRILAATLPLKRQPESHPTDVVTPLQSTAQLEHTVPGMARLERDGETTDVAVLGVTHTITPDKWFVAYKLGPHHLLDRQSDLDPGTPVAGSSTITSTSAALRHYVPANLPQDVTLYRWYYTTDSADASSITSDDFLFAEGIGTFGMASLQPGDLVETFASIADPWPSGMAFWVLYTSNPAPGSGNPSIAWREGQPCLFGVVP
jgi:hypothetical protein